MSIRSFGVAILVHAALIGVALNQLDRPEISEPTVATEVAVERQYEAPTPSSSPGQPGTLPSAEFHAPGSIPALDEVLLPEDTPAPQPQPPGRELNFEPTFTTERPTPPSRLPERKTPQTKPEPPSPEPAATLPASAPIQVSGYANPDVPPRLLNPSWPQSVRQDFVGTFIVKLIVGTNGRTLRVEIEQGTGSDNLDAAMRRTFEDALFTPGLVNGIPVVTDHRIRVHFRRAR